MNVNRIVRGTKSVLLFVVVVTSLCLSYMLWHGGWQNASEVGFTAEDTLPSSTVPNTQSATAPYRVLLNGTSNHVAVLSQGSEPYQNWLATLASLHVYGLHVVQSVPSQTTFRVEFDFGTDLDRTTMLNWVPNLSTSAIPVHGNEVVLYQTEPKGTVYLALEGDASNYVAQTDLNPASTSKSVTDMIHANPWVVWNQSLGSYIPGAGQTMQKVTWQTSTAAILPLVHSFFVNPQVLTRIQENPTTVLWTDGSKAVQLAEDQQSITFEDPNLTDHPLYADTDLNSAMSFMRNHGGGPGNLIAFADPNGSALNNTSAFSFVPFVNGYPVYGPQTNYQIEVYQGQIVQYMRPLVTFTKQLSATQDPILSVATLSHIVSHLAAPTPISNIEIRIGYFPVFTTTNATLYPAFFAYQSGSLTWVIDATSGTILMGGGQS